MQTTLAMSPEATAKRLTRLYGRTTESERAAGIAWYNRANDTMAELAAEFNVDIAAAARVVAVLSPNNRWASNIAGARTAMAFHAEGWTAESAFGRCGTYNVNISKAWRILDGDPTALSGPKVTAFAANLMGDTDFLTLDSWAVRAAMGWTREANFRDGSGPAQPGRNRAVIECGYRLAAKRCGVPVAHFQAVIWVHVRGAAE